MGDNKNSIIRTHRLSRRDLLLQAGIRATAVKARGQLSIPRRILVQVGVEQEQRVALLLPDGPEFVAAFLGAMKIGAVPVPLNTAARPGELQG